MNDTHYNTRSSEWIGDMTVWLRDNAGDNRDQLLQLRRKLRQAREKELTPCQQRVVELCFEKGMTVTQAAELLQVAPSTVSRTLRRAKDRLRRCLQYAL